jgi:hypothetical protein
MQSDRRHPSQRVIGSIVELTALPLELARRVGSIGRGAGRKSPACGGGPPIWAFTHIYSNQNMTPKSHNIWTSCYTEYAGTRSNADVPHFGDAQIFLKSGAKSETAKDGRPP